MSDVAAQLPPADRLAAVRAQMKALEEEEAGLRSLLLSDPSSRTGNRYLVEVREVTSQRVDLKELRALHPDIVDSQTWPVTTKRLELREIDEETGEVTRIKRTGK